MTTNETMFVAETEQNICPCGTKHDSFDLGTMRVQFCPEENAAYVLDETPVECEQEHDPVCDEKHMRAHDHSLNTDLSCGFTQVVTCDSVYTGGAWKRVIKRA